MPRYGLARFDAAFGGAVVALRPGSTIPQRFHGRHTEHLWCSRCTRAFPIGTYRQEGDLRFCPYADCGAHSLVDAMDWAAVRVTNLDYPQTPQLGMRYAFVASAQPRRGLPL
jgi:hypothetical protein